MDLQDWCISKLIMTWNVDLQNRKPTISWAVLKSMWSLGHERWLPSSTLLPRYLMSSTPSGSRTHIRKIWTYSNRSWEGAHRWSEGWSSSPVRTGWEIWDCLVWRKNDSVETIRKDRQAFFIREWSDRMKGNDFKQKDDRFDLRKNFLHCKSCPEKRMPHPWKCTRPCWMEFWATCLLEGVPIYNRYWKRNDLYKLPSSPDCFMVHSMIFQDRFLYHLRKDCISHWRKSKLNLLVCYTSQKPYDNAHRTAKSVREETV